MSTSAVSMLMNNLFTILYVKDQAKSKAFYRDLFQQEPNLDVPGMTEFSFFEGCQLGLMPENGISKIITPALPHPEKGSGIPRCELYFRVEHAMSYINRALELGAQPVSSFAKRDWGEQVGYVADFDGHVLAFAEKDLLHLLDV